MLVTAIVAASFAVPAIAGTYPVSGQNVADDPSGATSHMTGGLVGQWKITKAKQTAKKPLIQARGTERFVGCIDVALDGSCDGDPTGSLRLTWLYWAKPGSKPNTIVWGACWHPIVGGTGAFKGARGVVTMVDTPMPDGTVRTDYIGNVTIGAATTATKASAAKARRCGT
jgi:hypothetical protein